jgi:hypothetical protein
LLSILLKNGMVQYLDYRLCGQFSNLKAYIEQRDTEIPHMVADSFSCLKQFLSNVPLQLNCSASELVSKDVIILYTNSLKVGPLKVVRY